MFQATNQSWQLEHGLNIFPANQTFAHSQNVGIFKKRLGKTTATYFHYRRVLTSYKKVLKSPTPAKQYIQLEYSTNNHCYLGKTTAIYFHYRRFLTRYKKAKNPPPPQNNMFNWNIQQTTTAT